MSEHRAAIAWERTSESFDYKDYNREHTWTFEGGIEVPASSAPEFLGKPDRVDPEQAFVAALSSCHMLTFLAVAAKRHYVVDRYVDPAVGYMEKNDAGEMWISRVELRPDIAFSGERQPNAETVQKMHDQSHHACFIANSVKTDVQVIYID